MPRPRCLLGPGRPGRLSTGCPPSAPGSAQFRLGLVDWPPSPSRPGRPCLGVPARTALLGWHRQERAQRRRCPRGRMP
eukprot:14494887-Alexandrium_andersonii.AAC.1